MKLIDYLKKCGHEVPVKETVCYCGEPCTCLRYNQAIEAFRPILDLEMPCEPLDKDTIDVIIKEVNDVWSFNDYQDHTHTYRDKCDFILWLKKYFRKFGQPKAKELDEDKLWDIFVNKRGCKPSKEDCYMQRCHRYFECKLLIEEIGEAYKEGKLFKEDK